MLNVVLVSLPFSGCGGTLTTASGIFMSPNYPMPYYHNSECYWLLRGSRGTPFEIQFEQFHLENHPNCNLDYLAVCTLWHFAPQEAAEYDEHTGKERHTAMVFKCSHRKALCWHATFLSVAAGKKSIYVEIERSLKQICLYLLNLLCSGPRP